MKLEVRDSVKVTSKKVGLQSFQNLVSRCRKAVTEEPLVLSLAVSCPCYKRIFTSDVIPTPWFNDLV